MIEILDAEKFRFAMQTQRWLPSLADQKPPKPPTPPRGHNEHATRRSGDDLRPTVVVELCRVRQGAVSLFAP